MRSGPAENFPVVPSPNAVIPAKAGTHVTQPNMGPRFRGDDGVMRWEASLSARYLPPALTFGVVDAPEVWSMNFAMFSLSFASDGGWTYIM